MDIIKKLKINKEEWEDLAELDTYWMILTWPNKNFNRWDKKEFFNTGKEEIKNIIKKAKSLKYPKRYNSALDFGCGIGRTTKYLSEHFKKTHGLDISENMIEEAKSLNNNIKNCRFILNTKPNLEIFQNNTFDLIYTSLTLQHIPDKKLINSYITEFIRILKNKGLLVFQLPSQLNQKSKFHIHCKIYKILKKIGIKKQFIYKKLHLYPMRMNSIPKKEIIELLLKQKTKILKIEKDLKAGPSNKSRTYYVTK